MCHDSLHSSVGCGGAGCCVAAGTAAFTGHGPGVTDRDVMDVGRRYAGEVLTGHLADAGGDTPVEVVGRGTSNGCPLQYDKGVTGYG